jgi:hypothetical protein
MSHEDQPLPHPGEHDRTRPLFASP